MPATDRLVEDFVRWAESRDDVRAALLIGSRVRREHPADEFSDTDLVVFARDPDGLREDPSWVGAMGEPVITFVERTRGDQYERRVLYRDGRDVDYVIVPSEELQLLETDGARQVLARGFRILVDKDHRLAPALRSLPAATRDLSSADSYSEAVADFWYHALWTARKLARGEIFVAKECLDRYMKDLLVRMLRWHAGDRETWHEGRFLEEWADPRALADLRDAYAQYDASDVERALRSTMNLFAWLARETAERRGFAYAAGEEAFARDLVERVISSR